ncbi:cylicin-1-like [Prorops nasuta]|uniref:cylicin-1-like n=1 Tax=Prorops nasuta TaxID=863751 RepID=UPI0034CF0420
MSDSDRSKATEGSISRRDREILSERNELRRTAKDMPRNKLISALSSAGLKVRDCSEDQLRDRFVRYNLRDKFGPGAAEWNPREDELSTPQEPLQPLPTPSTVTAEAFYANTTDLITPQRVPKSNRQSEDRFRELFVTPREENASRSQDMSEASSDSDLTCIEKHRKLTPKPKRGVTFQSESIRSSLRECDRDDRFSESRDQPHASLANPREANATVGAIPPELLASIVQLVIAYQSAGAQGPAPVVRAPEMPLPREDRRNSSGNYRSATNRRRHSPEQRARDRSSSPERSSGSSSRHSTRRGTRVIDAFRKWNIRFKSRDVDDADDFIENLEHCRNVSDLTFGEIRETLPVVLSGEAKDWIKVEGNSYSTWRDFREAFLSQFGDEEDNDAKWEKARQQTQREGEAIKAYLVRIRSILKEIRPTPSVSVQLDLVYRNLRPNYRRRMFRRDFDSFAGLREIGREIEKTAEIDKAYKPPPGATKTREEEKSSRKNREALSAVSEKNDTKTDKKQPKKESSGRNAKKSDEEKPKKKKSRSRRGGRGKSKRRSSGSTSDSSSGSESSRGSNKKSSSRSSRRHSDKEKRKGDSGHSGHRSSSSDELGAIAAGQKQSHRSQSSSSKAPGGYVTGQSRYQERNNY